jgi:hypothetical protein
MRVKLGTVMLLVVIAALVLALIVQHQRATHREATLRIQAEEIRAEVQLYKSMMAREQRLRMRKGGTRATKVDPGEGQAQTAPGTRPED